MSRVITSTVAVFMLCAVPGAVLAQDQKEKPDEQSPKAKSVHDFTVKKIDGDEVKLDSYAGDVLLIVNVASKCGLTDRNYRKLEPMYQKYREQGLRVLAFPANNFLGQEPGTNKQIKAFCTTKYAATYDLFAKVSVKGQDICPLYKFLTEDTGEGIAGQVSWNFQKYLVGRDGKVLARFGPRVDPDDEKLTESVEKALAQPKPEPGSPTE
ncbi:MAG TPA: glutathione peroxidase [Phycisphaerae bacterium]|nr:glutathione peroxidase [Phycisphaerae bacterium]